MADSAAALKKAPGRPRRDGSRSNNQRAEILEAAVKLFKRNGYNATSMSAIAREAGLGQSSLYYWFKCKDEILREFLSTNRNPVAAADAAQDAGAGVAEQLYSLLYQDTKGLCELPFDYRLLEMAAHKEREEFSAFFEDYERLVSKVAELISIGVEEGVFQCDDPLAYAVVVVASDEGAQHRFHNMDAFPRLKDGVTADTVARTTALLSVQGLLRPAEPRWSRPR